MPAHPSCRLIPPPLAHPQDAGRAAKAEADAELAAQVDKLRRIDPLLSAVAAVPWLVADPQSAPKVALIKSQGLDELESWGGWVGWSMVWGGCRARGCSLPQPRWLCALLAGEATERRRGCPLPHPRPTNARARRLGCARRGAEDLGGRAAAGGGAAGQGRGQPGGHQGHPLPRGAARQQLRQEDAADLAASVRARLPPDTHLHIHCPSSSSPRGVGCGPPPLDHSLMK